MMKNSPLKWFLFLSSVFQHTFASNDDDDDDDEDKDGDINDNAAADDTGTAGVLTMCTV